MNQRQRSSLQRQRQLYQDGVVLTTGEMVDQWLPRRDRNAHKGDFGRVLIVAGSVGYTGAPVLAANAALRTGAGLIFVGAPEMVYPIVAHQLDEPMVFPLNCDESGRLNTRAVPQLIERLQSCDAVLLGPGLGRSPAILDVAAAVLQHAACPVILDADGINALEGNIDVVQTAACPVILTPHDGEFRRLVRTAKSADRTFPVSLGNCLHQSFQSKLLVVHRQNLHPKASFPLNITSYYSPCREIGKGFSLSKVH